MITTATLDKVATAIDQIVAARRTVEELIDIVLEDTGWQPGNGEKPHRLRELQQATNDLTALTVDLATLWS